ncbi:50S ribosomal protein L31 type B [Marmoricola endophyticus]|uniref:50S ribosomal protein L31 n=1 Tax=Marmoricola endophyticus TaxID=2040280 RepID=A0A917B9V1_9ACTN|nr:type B 50S ribosomal protein L31 [Marmoricola endophyticus]GGF31212.1 50S ribosomal protein L31 type B [Marmoricola endophyticus]
MKQGIHPAYGPTAFRDRSTGRVLLVRSTLAAGLDPGATVEVDGQSYPVVDVDVSSDSHPFWTGRTRRLDTEGRVQAFERRYGAR